MEERYEYGEPAKAYGVLIGCAVGTFFAAWGIDSFIQWWFKSEGTIRSILMIPVGALMLASLFAIVYIPSISTKLSDKFLMSSGKRFIVFGLIGIALFVTLTFTYGKGTDIWVGILYFAVVLFDGISIMRKRRKG